MSKKLVTPLTTFPCATTWLPNHTFNNSVPPHPPITRPHLLLFLSFFFTKFQSNQTMAAARTSTPTSTWVFPIFLLASIFVSAISPPYLQLVGLFLCLAVLVLVMARAAMVAWITVLVLLTFAGKRRRVLVHEGRKITADVAGHLVQVLWPGSRGICDCC